MFLQSMFPLLHLFRRLTGHIASYNQDRTTPDKFAVSSYQKAEAAQKAGHFEFEIVPVTVEGTRRHPTRGDI
jgi:acetyl-CoA acetyltransferase